jgi:serine protease
MQRNTRRSILFALSVLLCNSMPVLAGGPSTGNFASNNTARVSDRLVVKYKANNLPAGLSVAQINAQLSQPLTAQTVSQLQVAASAGLTELHAIFNGAHVLAVAGKPDRQSLDLAIANIGNLPNVEYVEEDRIMTVQMVPNDTFYTTGSGGYPGLWDMWPVTAVTSPAPGGTGSYGGDFQTAWDTVTGSGVVVAVVDTGITPNVDIVGPGGTVAAGAGSNLVSVGYDFTSDCRTRGSCAATTATASAAVAPSANATDLGDFITSADATTSYFTGCSVSNSSWHGTHVSGTIAALGNNNTGVIGGAYNAKILPVRVLGKCGGYTSDIANGIMWAAGLAVTVNSVPVPVNPNPAKIINMSLGGSGACNSTLQSAITAAVGAGTVVVVAAGNSNADVANFHPANCTGVISVASIGRDGSRAYYSNYSSPATNHTNPTNVTLAAQGGDMNHPTSFEHGILSTLNSGTTTPVLTGGSSYAWYQGTSMATPHVVAAAALIVAKNPALTPAQIKTILSAPSSLSTFPSFSTAGWTAYDCATLSNCGAGILNANLALQNTPFSALTGSAAADFGSVLVGTTVDQVVTLTNSSQVPVLQAGAITRTGTNAALFTFVAGADTCTGATIAANASCHITVRYAPLAAGAHVATLTVPISGATAPTLISLNGSAGSTALTTSDVTAPTVTLGQTTTVDVGFNNPNTIALKTGAVILSNSAIMAKSNDLCSNVTLVASGSCTVTVAVSPTAEGSYTGTASLGLSGGGGTAIATISGVVNAVPPPPSSGGGGGGCSIMPSGVNPDVSLMLAMLAVGVYWLRRRVVRDRGAV